MQLRLPDRKSLIIIKWHLYAVERPWKIRVLKKIKQQNKFNEFYFFRSENLGQQRNERVAKGIIKKPDKKKSPNDKFKNFNNQKNLIKLQ